MHPALLDPAIEARLRAAEFTYPEVGQSAHALPSGYATFSRTRTVASPDLATASAALMSWQVHLRSGIHVAASSPHVELGSVLLLRLGIGPLHVSAPCRVVYLVDEPARQGFAYGTLPGHPEAGEELFLLERRGDDRITFTIRSFSRPATALTKLSGPVGRAAQSAVTARYLAAIDER